MSLRPQASKDESANTKFTDDAKDTQSQEEKILIAPGQGKRSTRKRNQRRKMKSNMERLRAEGLFPTSTATEDISPENHESKGKSATSFRQMTGDKDFEAQRRLLLASIASGDLNIETLGYRATEEMANTMAPKDTSKKSKKVRASKNLPPPSSALHDAATEAISLSTADQSSPTNMQTSGRRSKLDLASSRRLLFGSLGLRVPKTKEDEDKLRAKIMANARSSTSKQELHTTQESDPDQSENWRDKIILKAAECWNEGVKLSEPPFPFIQRWYQSEGFERKSTKGQKRKSRVSTATSESCRDENATGMDERVEKYLGHQTRPSGEELTSDLPDLPDLPRDLSTLEALAKDGAVPGSIIAFKQLEMSAATSWAPEISSYRTALISGISADGLMDLDLAQRDRKGNSKTYDELTGERVYGKFEMPDDDDDDDDDESGRLQLTFHELIEPKLIGTRALKPMAGEELPQRRENGTQDHTHGITVGAGLQSQTMNEIEMEAEPATIDDITRAPAHSKDNYQHHQAIAPDRQSGDVPHGEDGTPQWAAHPGNGHVENGTTGRRSHSPQEGLVSNAKATNKSSFGPEEFVSSHPMNLKVQEAHLEDNLTLPAPALHQSLDDLKIDLPGATFPSDSTPLISLKISPAGSEGEGFSSRTNGSTSPNLKPPFSAPGELSKQDSELDLSSKAKTSKIPEVELGAVLASADKTLNADPVNMSTSSISPEASTRKPRVTESSPRPVLSTRKRKKKSKSTGNPRIGIRSHESARTAVAHGSKAPSDISTRLANGHHRQPPSAQSMSPACEKQALIIDLTI